jgi:hypothetical protein
MAWLVLHILYVLLGTWMTHRTLLKGIGGQWLLHDVAIPFLATAGIGVLAWKTVQEAALPIYARLAVGGLFALLALVICILLSPGLSTQLSTRLLRKKANVAGQAADP